VTHSLQIFKPNIRQVLRFAECRYTVIALGLSPPSKFEKARYKLLH